MAMIKRIALTAGAIAAVGVGGFFALGLMSQGGSAPGLVEGRLAPCPDTPNCVSSEEGTDAAKSVEVLAPEAWERLPGVIETLGGTIIEEREDYMAAEFRSAFFGFVDDVEFRRADDGVHVRSASRVGYSDGGVNARRVADIRSAIG